MSWWQGKFLHYGLRYVLSRTGFLDDRAIDPKDLDISLGRKNVIELKDVGLNIKKISKLAQLPPNLRIETARVLSLRLTVPADIWQSSIVAEVDGVELVAWLDNIPAAEDENNKRKSRARVSASARSPQHRKVHRRIHSPPPYDPGGMSESDEDVHIPTTQEVAMSFLREEPVQERSELEASVAMNNEGLDESIMSESSESSAVGTGPSMGLPGFLENFGQGIFDRFQLHVKNILVKLETEVGGESGEAVPVTVQFRVGAAEADRVESVQHGDDNLDKRHVRLCDISLDLLSDAGVPSELSAEHSSQAESRRVDLGSARSEPAVTSPGLRGSPRLASELGQPVDMGGSTTSGPDTFGLSHASAITANKDYLADAAGNTEVHSAQPESPELEIRPGDDNISWGSRRSKTSAPTENLWNSMTSDDDIPDNLLLERASTPRAHSPRGASPAAVRARRPMSPYERSIQSPVSWPKLDVKHERNRSQKGPDSWPMLDQSEQSTFQPFMSGIALEGGGAMDNKLHALEASLTGSDASIQKDDDNFEDPAESEEDRTENLMESRLYSHEDAQSMYMSAMSHTPKVNAPGAWDSEPAESQRSISPDTKRRRDFDEVADSRDTPSPDAAVDYERQYPVSGNSTPRPQSPQSSRPSTFEPAAKRLLSIDQASIHIPSKKQNDSKQQQQEQQVPSRTQPDLQSSVHFGSRGIPGTFSAYSNLAASHKQSASSVYEESRSVLWSPKPGNSVSEDESLEFMISSVQCAIDIPSCRLLYRMATLASASLKIRGERQTKGNKETSSDPQSTIFPASLTIKQLHLSLLERLHPRYEQTPDPGLITVELENTRFSTATGDINIRVGRFRTLVSGSRLLTFDRESKMQSSVVLTEHTPDIAVLISTNKVTVNKRPVTEVSAEILPVKVELDMSAVEDTLSSFGGLSGVIELSSSALSEGGVFGPAIPSGKTSKGVRFQDDPQSDNSAPELKVTGIIGGMDVALRREVCAVKLQTSKVKALYREYATAVTVDHVSLSGPHRTGTYVEPISASLGNIRVEYLPTPADKDLERLLSLLTPSKDKYDNDDDILIDTLLRQRRHGSMARVTAGDVKVKIADFEFLQPLTDLSGELNKLSAVAKYLPDDERPGVLTLVRVRAFEAQVPVNKRFGKLQIIGQDFYCAHVGLPALLAFSLGNIHVVRSAHGDLLHPLIPLAGNSNLPMLMLRMLGNEAEPTVKLKLFNVCVEYSVPTIIALTNMDDPGDTQEFVTELAKSVTELAIPAPEAGKGQSSPTSDTSRASTKKTKIDVLIHDSAVGLRPDKFHSKGMLVMTDTKFTTLVPPENALTAVLELRRAALFVTDNADSRAVEGTQPRHSRKNDTTDLLLGDELSQQGYVSVGSIRRTEVAARVGVGAEGKADNIEADVKSELFLVETCADSTQTMLDILASLTPPTPPSKEPKYLTQPMTIEDMMSSFTGEPEVKQDTSPETLFDVEKDTAEEPESLLEAPTLGDEADMLLAESQMTSSLYGPVSGLLEGVDEPEDDEDAGNDDFPETTESLLEEDPFEMPSSPTDYRFSDSALIRELNKQSKRAASDELVDISPYEVEDLGFHALGADQQALGSAHRFGRPTVRGRKLFTGASHQKMPLRLRIRDINFIWHIHDGYDWQKTREGITQAVEEVELKVEERKARRQQAIHEREDNDSIIGDVLFNSVYIGVPANSDAQEIRRQINRGIDDLVSETESVPVSGMSRPTTYSASGRPVPRKSQRRLKLERSRAHKASFELKNLSADVLVFPPNSGDVVGSIDLRVKDLEIFDNVPTSTWRKFVTRLHTSPRDREMSKPMVHIEILNVRTLQDFAASEIVIHASILPLRLHVDQDALDFIVRFFNFKDDSARADLNEAEQPFLQRLEVDDVDVRLDYKPKRVDYAGLRSGHTSEFMNFVTLEDAPIKLRHTIVYGLRGFGPIHKTLNDIWMPDVTRNQLPPILGGLAAMRSFTNIGVGFKDVVAIPVREYRKDGRLVRSIQKGAFQFGKTTTSELVRLGAKIAIGTQNFLQGTEDLLSPASGSPSSGRPSMGRKTSAEWEDVAGEDDGGREESRAISAYANQPMGLVAGLRNARRSLEHDLLTARDAFVAVQGEVLESASPGVAAAAVARNAPVVILRPVIGATRAVGTTLLGVGNQIDRENLKRIEDKYKRT